LRWCAPGRSESCWDREDLEVVLVEGDELEERDVADEELGTTAASVSPTLFTAFELTM
jgi:hypothetical protein